MQCPIEDGHVVSGCLDPITKVMDLRISVINYGGLVGGGHSPAGDVVQENRRSGEGERASCCEIRGEAFSVVVNCLDVRDGSRIQNLS